MRGAGTVAGFIVVMASNAMAMDLQVGIAPLLGQVPAGGENHTATGIGATTSYVQPHQNYTVDIFGHCMWSKQEFSTTFVSYPASSIQHVRLCDLTVGTSYRLGYPFTVKATSRFGIALGLAVGLRHARMTARRIVSENDNTLEVRLPQSTYGLVVQPRATVEYRFQRLSVGVYVATPITYESRIVIDPTIGFLASTHLQI